MIRILLWDVDGTLLDFQAAERAALESLFRAFSLGTLKDEMIRRYSEINDGFWKRLERNEITRQEVLVGRFRVFFGEMGIPGELAEVFNERYQEKLGDTVVFRDDSFHLVESLRGRVRQYVVSNGTVVSQRRKLARSGLGEMMDGIFLSEAVGAEKPARAFFDAVFAQIPPAAGDEIMIVGDSLTSDILGGILAGIRTCWYNPEGKAVPEGMRIDHVIRDLREVLSCLEA